MPKLQHLEKVEMPGRVMMTGRAAAPRRVMRFQWGSGVQPLEQGEVLVQWLEKICLVNNLQFIVSCLISVQDVITHRDAVDQDNRYPSF